MDAVLCCTGVLLPVSQGVCWIDSAELDFAKSSVSSLSPPNVTTYK